MIPNAVTEIGVSAFENCSGFTGSLTLPSTLTSISNNAFYDCGFTGALAIPNGVTTIGGSAFAACDGFTSLTLPASVTSLVNYAFSGCTGLTRMTVFSTTPPTVGATTFSSVTKTIPVFVPCSALEDYQTASGWSTFTNMQCLEMLTYSINDDGVSVTVTGHVDGSSATGPVVIPETTTINGVTYTVTAIGDYAFDNCQGLTGSLIIPNTVTTIGNDAFNWCTGFNGTLTIGSSVTTIGEYAFYNCPGFTGSLTIPNSVTTIGENAFHYDSGFDGTLTLGTSLSSIGFSAFSGCSGFTGTLTLPSSLTTMGNGAFVSCSGFTGALVIPDGVTTIGNSAFSGCSGLTSLTLPASMTSLGNYAFADCTGLTTMTVLPVTPPTLGNYVFRNVPTTISVYVPCAALEDYLAAANWNAFTHIQCLEYEYLTYSINDDGTSVTVTGHVDGTAATGEIIIPETRTIDGVTYTVTAIGNNAFKNCSGLTGDLIIPNTVTSIGYSAFDHCNGFTGSLILSNSLTTIGSYAFYSCTGFTGSLTIPNSVTSIGSNAFYYLNGLTGSLTIGDAVTTIGYQAFAYCRSLSGTLTIGSSVNTIGDRAFQDCYNVTSMTVLPETPPTLASNSFYNVPIDIPVFVPCVSLEDYQSAEGWNAFAYLQCPPETFTVCDGTDLNNSIPAYIFYFDDFTRSQFVIPSNDLVEMIGASIISMTFYTNSMNVPYHTVSDADVYLKEVDYTQINDFEPKESATAVYSGRFNIVSTEEGGEMTIYFNTPYTYQGGNLLVGVENTEDLGARYIRFYGKTASGASIVGRSTTSGGTMTATQQNFIPKTTFGFHPVCEPKTLPYTYGFEEEDEFDCWTMLDCHEQSGRVRGSTYAVSGNYGFRFFFTTNPPQYLVSPKLECPTEVEVSFYYKNQDGPQNWPETFQVGYSTTTKSPDAFTWGEALTADNSTWTLYENTFPAGTKYVAIKHLSYDQNVLCLDDFSFTTVSPTQMQTIALASGWNWVSFNVEITMDDLKAAVVAANPGAAPVIKSKGKGQTSYNGAVWVGALKTLDLSQMYEIKVANACTVTLEGARTNPAAHPATIKNGVNWIAYPLDETMSVATAFAGFPVSGDNVKSKDGGQATWNGVMWLGALKNLVPGTGYLYISKATDDKTLTF